MPNVAGTGVGLVVTIVDVAEVAGAVAGVLRCHTTMPTMIIASGMMAASQIQLGRLVPDGAGRGGEGGVTGVESAGELVLAGGRVLARWRAACFVFLLMTCVRPECYRVKQKSSNEFCFGDPRTPLGSGAFTNLHTNSNLKI